MIPHIVEYLSTFTVVTFGRYGANENCQSLDITDARTGDTPTKFVRKFSYNLFHTLLGPRALSKEQPKLKTREINYESLVSSTRACSIATLWKCVLYRILERFWGK